MATAIPIFRIFDVDKALEFYRDWLGFSVDWQDKSANTPTYLAISLQGIVLHLTEHYGDCTPGARIHIENFTGLRVYHKELLEKNYKFMHPGIGKTPWNSKVDCMEVIDPFGNRLTFTGEG